MRFAAALSLTSTPMPIPDNTAASVIAAGSSTSATTTVNPSRAKRPAMALPIPLAAPVTMAVLMKPQDTRYFATAHHDLRSNISLRGHEGLPIVVISRLAGVADGPVRGSLSDPTCHGKNRSLELG